MTTTARPTSTIANCCSPRPRSWRSLASPARRRRHRPPPQKATSACWLAGRSTTGSTTTRSTAIYAIPCYTQAIQQLNAYPDVAGYSSAVDDIQRAELAGDPRTENSGGTPAAARPGARTAPERRRAAAAGKNGGGGKSFFQRIADRLGPGNAQSIPLPLLVLGGLALLLLLAALATWLARRIQARRMTPAPAPAPRR